MAHVDENTGRLIYDEITEHIVVQANYLASMQDEYWIDDGINIYTGLMPWNWGSPPCSHTEWGCWVDGELWFCSSTSRKELGVTGVTGTRWIKGSKLLRHPERWRLQIDARYPLSGSNSIENCICRANMLMGRRSDFHGVIVDFINPIRVFIKREVTAKMLEKIKKIYCSKFVYLVDTGWYTVMSPKRIFKKAKKAGYTTVPDTESFLMMRGVI